MDISQSNNSIYVDKPHITPEEKGYVDQHNILESVTDKDMLSIQDDNMLGDRESAITQKDPRMKNILKLDTSKQATLSKAGSLKMGLKRMSALIYLVGSRASTVLEYVAAVLSPTVMGIFVMWESIRTAIELYKTRDLTLKRILRLSMGVLCGACVLSATTMATIVGGPAGYLVAQLGFFGLVSIGVGYKYVKKIYQEYKTSGSISKIFKWPEYKTNYGWLYLAQTIVKHIKNPSSSKIQQLFSSHNLYMLTESISHGYRRIFKGSLIEKGLKVALGSLYSIDSGPGLEVYREVCKRKMTKQSNRDQQAH